MFILFTINEYENIEEQIENGTGYNCNSCYHIAELNKTIDDLRVRISYLESIRDLENIIDCSYNNTVIDKDINNITNQFSNLTIISNMSDPGDNVTIAANTFSFPKSICSNDPYLASVWDSEFESSTQIPHVSVLCEPSHENECTDSCLKSVLDGESELSTQIPNLSVLFEHNLQNDCIDSIIDTSSESENICSENSLSLISDDSLCAAHDSFITSVETDDKSKTESTTASFISENLNEGFPSTLVLNPFPMVVNRTKQTGVSIPSMVFNNSNSDMYKNNKVPDYSRSVDPLSKFQKDNHVKTLIIGDSSLKNILLNTYLMREDEYFKIARPGATISDSINNALYFVYNLLPKISNVILQVGLADTIGGKTEKMKSELQRFILLMNEVNIGVVICGPIPYSCMTNESFSRAYALNMWLVNGYRWYGSESFRLIDAFDLLWNNKNNAFIHNKMKLSNFGHWLLEGEIMNSIEQSD